MDPVALVLLGVMVALVPITIALITCALKVQRWANSLVTGLGEKVTGLGEKFGKELKEATAPLEPMQGTLTCLREGLDLVIEQLGTIATSQQMLVDNLSTHGLLSKQEQKSHASAKKATWQRTGAMGMVQGRLVAKEDTGPSKPLKPSKPKKAKL